MTEDDAAALARLSAAPVDAGELATYRDTAAAARRDWPTVALRAEDFAAYVLERLSGSGGLSSLRIGDLYIACGCARGVRGALDAFEDAFFDEVDGAHRRVRRSSIGPEELRQRMRERLFVPAERPPRIVEYRGTGSLRAWVRVTASRMALNLATRGPREESGDVEALAVAADGDGPELGLLKAKYGAELRAAFIDAVATIDAEDKAFLLHAHVDGLSIDRVAAIYGIHRATAARRIERARRALVEATTRALSARLGNCSPTEAKSIIALAESQFDVTVERVLREG